MGTMKEETVTSNAVINAVWDSRPIDGKPNPNDPFLTDYEPGCVLILEDRPEFSTDQLGELQPEFRDWLRINTPDVKFDYRINPLDKQIWLILAFKKPNDAVLFKLKWWGR